MTADVIAVKGTTIRARRYAKGLKVFELAAIVGITPSHLSAIETGSKRPGPTVLSAIAEALGLDPDRLITVTTVERARKPRAAKAA